MDHAKTLIRSIARAFYDIRHILVVEALMVHSALSVDDFHHLTGIQQKDLRKLLGKLKEDRLVSVQSRQEVKVGNNKPIHRDFYYINFHASIDAIKYRIFFLTKKTKDTFQPSEEKKEYLCPRCKAQYTQLEVLTHAFEGGFLCHRCDGVLQRDETSAADSIGHQTQSRLMSQLEPFLELLKRIDAEEIPQNDFDTALSNAVPVARDSETHPVTLDAAVDAKQDIKFMPKLKQEFNMEVKVNFVSEESARVADEQAKERKAAQERQNALPAWHTQSTVDIPKAENSPTSSATPGLRVNGAEPVEDKKLNVKQASEMEEYIASLKAEQARAEQEEDEDDEDDDGFEDVDIGSAVPSGIATPRSGMSMSTPLGSFGALNGKGKRNAEDDGEAGFGNGSMNGLLDNSPVKKIKLEESAAASAASTPNDKDSDEDEEFEDAL